MCFGFFFKIKTALSQRSCKSFSKVKKKEIVRSHFFLSVDEELVSGNGYPH